MMSLTATIKFGIETVDTSITNTFRDLKVLSDYLLGAATGIKSHRDSHLRYYASYHTRLEERLYCLQKTRQEYYLYLCDHYENEMTSKDNYIHELIMENEKITKVASHYREKLAVLVAFAAVA